MNTTELIVSLKSRRLEKKKKKWHHHFAHLSSLIFAVNLVIRLYPKLNSGLTLIYYLGYVILDSLVSSVLWLQLVKEMGLCWIIPKDSFSFQ